MCTPPLAIPSSWAGQKKRVDEVTIHKRVDDGRQYLLEETSCRETEQKLIE